MARRDAASRTQQPSDDLVKHRHNEKASTDARVGGVKNNDPSLIEPISAQ
jgi:hypothetical protein